MLSIISRIALGTPDISNPTSKPSFMPSSACASRSRVLETSTASVTPILRASSSRYSLTSVTTTNRAPLWRAAIAAINPMGPAPVMSTSSATSLYCVAT